MSIDLKQNYFELFDLPVRFDIDLTLLATNFRQLQAHYHPDKFVSASDSEQRQAMQATVFINEAHDTLKSPRLRSRYLLELAGIDFNDERDISTDTAYLMQQLEIRESIDVADDAEDPLEHLEEIKKLVRDRKQAVEASFVESYKKGDFQAAKEATLKMRFCERVYNEIRKAEERLEDEYF